jgi:hypothetical protein
MNAYRNRLAILLEEAVPGFTSTDGFAFKNVFGAIGGVLHGTIVISSGRFGIALRLPPQELAGLFMLQEVEQLRYFPTGHIKKEYAVLRESILNDQERFKFLLNASMEYVAPGKRGARED